MYCQPVVWTVHVMSAWGGQFMSGQPEVDSTCAVSLGLTVHVLSACGMDSSYPVSLRRTAHVLLAWG